MTTEGREYQQTKLYRFERKYIAPRDESRVPFDQAQILIDYMWAELGYKYPPRIDELSKNATRIIAHATRHEICIPRAGTQTWTLIHELAHSLTMMPSHLAYNDEVAGHGEEFVGAYFMLCERFLGIPMLSLIACAQKVGLAYKVFGKAAFED